MSDTPQQIDGAVVDDFDFLARELALLLTVSDLQSEDQQALLDAVPHMQLEEIVELISILEAKYTVAQTADLDVILEKKLEQISQTFSNHEAAIDADTIKKLEMLAENIE